MTDYAFGCGSGALRLCGERLSTIRGGCMDRRSFLKFSAMAAAISRSGLVAGHAAASLNRVRLSITWGMFRNMPVAEAMAHLARLDYDGFEMFNWRSADMLSTVASEMRKYKLECATLVANKGVKAPGCSLTNPKERG